MNKKKLILSSALCLLSVATLFIMFIPIVSNQGVGMDLFPFLTRIELWYSMEEYLWGIATLISIICLPLLFFGSILSILCACGQINNRKIELTVYIINIVLAFLVLGVTVNYFLGLGRTIGMSGLKLFKGSTWFDCATAFFYLHCALSLSALVVACLNCPKRK